jgi:hypothetical protein
MKIMQTPVKRAAKRKSCRLLLLCGEIGEWSVEVVNTHDVKNNKWLASTDLTYAMCEGRIVPSLMSGQLGCKNVLLLLSFEDKPV